MRNEANREVWGATALRKCETKPIRRERVRDWADMVGAGATEQSQSGGVSCEGDPDAKQSQSAGVGGAARTPGPRARNKANPIFGQYGKVRIPLCFQYKTGVERFGRMCMNRLVEIAVTEKGSSDVADFDAVAVNVGNRGVIGNADQHPSLQDALQADRAGVFRPCGGQASFRKAHDKRLGGKVRTMPPLSAVTLFYAISRKELTARRVARMLEEPVPVVTR